MPRTHPLTSWIILVASCASAPFVFVYIQGAWSLLLVPSLKISGVSSPFGTRVLMLVFNCFGAAIAATLLAGLVAWFVQLRPIVLAICLSVVTSFVVLVLLTNIWLESYTVMVIAVAEQLTFFLISIAITILVFRHRRVADA